MKTKLFAAIILSFYFALGTALPARAQTESATSTETASTTQAATSTTADVAKPVITTGSATSTATTTSLPVPTAITISSTVVTGLPEWGTDTKRQSYIWKTSANLIREEISELAPQPSQNLSIPILFGIAPANLTQNFGDPRGSGRSHEGLDIMAPKGAPIVSPTQAVVLGIGTGPDSGNYVYTANPGGETFVYMHLDRTASLAAGSILAPGDLVGYVGNTGNASGGAPHLHFEIRKNGATDPFSRLKIEFTLPQKMSFLSKIFSGTSDKIGFAKFVVSAYSTQISAAKNSGIAIPAEINSELARITLASASGSLWAGLAVGSRGDQVVDLQNFLISQSKGPAAAKLGHTGPTGYFGTLTRDALAEYQASNATSNNTLAKMTKAQILARIAQIKALILTLQQQLKLMQKAA